MKPIRALLLCLALLAGNAVAAPLPVTEVAPGVYVHQGAHEELDVGYHGDISNIGFIVGRDSVAVIDSGGSLVVGQRLREAIRQVTPLPVRYVINTHVHPDHIFGNAAFLPDRPDFVGHAKLADAMELRRDIYLRNNAAWLGADAQGSDIVKPTLAVAAAHELDLGGRSLLLTAYPVAHTNTDLSVLDSQSGTLWSGDLLITERTPSVDGDLKGWLQVLEDMRSVAAARVVPGHGAVPADWRQALDKHRHYLATLLADVRASIRRGEPMEQAMQHAAAAEKEQWVLFDSVNRRNVNIVFPALEWE